MFDCFPAAPKVKYCLQNALDVSALSGKEDEYQKTIEMYQSKVRVNMPVNIQMEIKKT